MKLLTMKNRKGISPLIATLLLIAIAVAASVLTYSWVMSMIGSQSAQAQTQLRIDAVSFTSKTVVIRNTGSTDAVLESVWVRENKAGSAWVEFDNGGTTPELAPTALQVGKSTPVVVTGLDGTGFVAGTSYVVRITSNTGFFYEYIVTK